MFEMGRPLRNSVKAIVIKDHKLLLTRNKDEFGEYYLLPGGGQKFNENMHNALKRECLEETGYGVKPIELKFIREYIGKNHEFNDDVHQIEYMFMCRIIEENKDEFQNFDDYQLGYEWINLKKLNSIRIYPKIIKEVISENGKLDKRIYLGDVN